MPSHYVAKNNARGSELLRSKRIRPALALPTIRKHYNNYNDARVDWLDVFRVLDDAHNKKAALLEYNSGIRYVTAMRRYKQWRVEGRPTDSNSPSAQDNRGGSNAAMSPHEERLCYLYITANYLQRRKPVNQSDLRVLIRAFYQQLHPRLMRGVADLRVGASYVTRFMRKFGLFCSHGRIMKQRHITDKSTAVAQLYLAKCARAYAQYSPSLLLTMDETFWPLLPRQQSHVRVRSCPDDRRPASSIDDKTGVTLVVTVASDGGKLPLYFVAKGKTMLCTQKLDVHQPHLAFFAERGWVREDVMLHYLDSVVAKHTAGRPCALLLDSYAAHITLAVYEKAKDLNIELIVVPCCMTATLAPLDVGVNAVLKSRYSKDWRQHRLFGAEDDDVTLPWASAIDMAVKAYRALKPSSIRSSFLKATLLPPPKHTSMLQLVATEEKCRLDMAKVNAGRHAHAPTLRRMDDHMPTAYNQCNSYGMIPLASVCAGVQLVGWCRARRGQSRCTRMHTGARRTKNPSFRSLGDVLPACLLCMLIPPTQTMSLLCRSMTRSMSLTQT
jgi:hypothetical protein